MNKPVSPKGFKEGKFAYHEEIELEIQNLTNLGKGVGRVDGWVVMVPFALPGEKVRARVFRNLPNYSDADLVEVIEASPKRVEPVCPLFGECGGCQYQNLDYVEQLAFKTNQVKELLTHMLKQDLPVNDAIGSPEQFGYRSKLTPHFNKPKDGKELKIGFLKMGYRNWLVDVEQCPIATKEINEALPVVRQQVFDNAESYKNGATILLRHVEEGVVSDYKAIVTEKVADLQFKFKASEFFQNNPFILPVLAEYVYEQAKGESINYFIDTYCGSGLFALYAGRHFKESVGIEISEKSIEYARNNAKLNGVENCKFIVGDATSIFSQVTYNASESVVIVDPPRKGCSQEFLEQLFSFGPKKVVYVSCDPATQVRDIGLFLEAGYEVAQLQPFDLFPQTRHIENVATLVRK